MRKVYNVGLKNPFLFSVTLLINQKFGQKVHFYALGLYQPFGIWQKNNSHSFLINYTKRGMLCPNSPYASLPAQKRIKISMRQAFPTIATEAVLSYVQQVKTPHPDH